MAAPRDLADRLEAAAHRLREADDRPGAAFEAVRSLPAELGAFWSASPQAQAKSFRADLVVNWARGVQAVLDGLGWQGQVILTRDGLTVELDGVRLHADRDHRFFRKSGHSAGRALLERLRQVIPEPRCVIDIGANIGEISLFFARHLPEAQIVAVEASSENVAELERNRRLQTFATDNLRVVQAAVSDREGSVDITVGAGDMNTILVAEGVGRLRSRGSTGVERVRAITLDTIMEAAGGGPVDFIKIDIEGAEPLLAEALARHAGAVRTLFIEFSVFNAIEAYVALNDRLLAAGYRVFDSKMRPIAEPADWLAAALAKVPSVNLWYLDRALLAGRQ